ncbi:MAG: hypothetical protein ACC655_10815 [Rhodothermia bacterium]
MRNTALLVGLLFATGAMTTVNAQYNIDSLMIGGQPSPELLHSIAADGYEAVLSVRAPGEIDWDEAALVDSLGMIFVNIPMPNPVSEITDEQLEQFDTFMSANKRSFLHCGSGNRISGLWATWLIEYRDVDPAEALARAEARGMRPNMREVVEKRLPVEKTEH